MESNLSAAIAALRADGWFNSPGAYVLVDGQFGSTGKGVAASLLERTHNGSGQLVAWTNAGPNSGHTAQHDGRRFMTQQLPVSAVQRAHLMCGDSIAYLNAGAIIDMAKLAEEIGKFGMSGMVFVHPNAAIIEDEDRAVESDPTSGPARIAGTGKGVGAALARKVLRSGAIARSSAWELNCMGAMVTPRTLQDDDGMVLLETAQGFSLGINQPFYPHCTSRECTVGQAMSDAGIHSKHLRKTMMAVRTYPIRVGNTSAGNSGGCYPDQRETSWQAIGVEPELTSVTKRVRRVFTWSREQFREALRANRPDAVFVTFMDYLRKGEHEPFLETLRDDCKAVLNKCPVIITGWGPDTKQVGVVE